MVAITDRLLTVQNIDWWRTTTSHCWFPRNRDAVLAHIDALTELVAELKADTDRPEFCRWCTRKTYWYPAEPHAEGCAVAKVLGEAVVGCE